MGRPCTLPLETADTRKAQFGWAETKRISPKQTIIGPRRMQDSRNGAPESHDLSLDRVPVNRSRASTRSRKTR